MINHFTFNGTSTAQLGLIVSGVSIFGAGSRKVEKAGIPGRNGDLQIELGGFNNYTVRYTVSITKNFTTTAQQIREWLLESKGYCDLTDTYHPDEIRKACFNSDIEFTTSMLYKYGQASIQFDCLPERYLTTNTPITTTATADTTTDTTLSLSTVPTPITISLNGNTTQEGSSGKNLIGLNQASYTGTLTNQYFMAFGSNSQITPYNLTANTTYVFSAYVESSAKPFNVSVGCGNGYYERDIQMSSTYTFSENGRVWVRFTPTATDLQSGSLFAFRVPRYTTQTTFTYTVRDVQLEIGSEVTAYEPHISPTNPQAIHSVSGSNEVKIVGKNIFTFPTWQTVSTAPLYNGYRKVKLLLPPNTTYYLNTTFKNGYSPVGLNMYVLVGDYLNTVYKSIAHSAYGAQNGTVTTNADGELYIGVYNATQTKYEELIENSQVQLEKGSTATTYEPYTRQSYSIDFPVENLIPKATTSTLYGVTFTVANDGTITTSGTSTAIIYYPVKTDLTLPSDTYTLSGAPKDASDTTTFIYTTPNYHSDYGNTRTFTDTVEKVYIYVASGQNMDGKVFKPQIEKGSKANAYTPYGTPPIELNKIGTYSDYIYKNGGKWYVHKEFNKVDLGTITTWTKSSSGNKYYSTITPPYKWASNDVMLCSSYNFDGIGNSVRGFYGANGTFRYGYNASSSTSYSEMYFTNESISTLADFKTSVNGVFLYYPLRTSTNTEITDTTLINQLNNIEKAYSYNGTTNILQVSNDNGFMLAVVSLHGSTFTSNYKGEPIITVNSTGLIYLNGEVMEVLSAPVTINCQTMQCYNGVVNMNNEVRVNDFPEIKIGENTVGSSMALTITPNNWRH